MKGGRKVTPVKVKTVDYVGGPMNIHLYVGKDFGDGDPVQAIYHDMEKKTVWIQYSGSGIGKVRETEFRNFVYEDPEIEEKLKIELLARKIESFEERKQARWGRSEVVSEWGISYKRKTESKYERL